MKEKKLKQLNLSKQQEELKLSEESQNNSKSYLVKRETYDVFELVKFSDSESVFIALGNDLILECEDMEDAKIKIDAKAWGLLFNAVISIQEKINKFNKNKK